MHNMFTDVFLIILTCEVFVFAFRGGVRVHNEFLTHVCHIRTYMAQMCEEFVRICHTCDEFVCVKITAQQACFEFTGAINMNNLEHVII